MSGHGQKEMSKKRLRLSLQDFSRGDPKKIYLVADKCDDHVIFHHVIDISTPYVKTNIGLWLHIALFVAPVGCLSTTHKVIAYKFLLYNNLQMVGVTHIPTQSVPVAPKWDEASNIDCFHLHLLKAMRRVLGAVINVFVHIAMYIIDASRMNPVLITK